MKSFQLTARQQAALDKAIAQGNLKGIDKGMISALQRKGCVLPSPPTLTDLSVSAQRGPFVIFDTSADNAIVRVKAQGAGCTKDAKYATLSAAKAALTRMARDGMEAAVSGRRVQHENVSEYQIASLEVYNKEHRRMVERTNFMTGRKFLEDVNTPHYCSPSSETFWSM